MSSANSFILKVKRGDTRWFRVLRKLARTLLAPKGFVIPNFLRAPLRVAYEMHFGVIMLWNSFWNIFYRMPLFQARCASFGRDVVVDRLPFVVGHVEIHVGNKCWIGGNVSIFSGSSVDHPVLELKDHAEIGWNVTISVSRSVVIEEHARLASGCTVADSDGHPREADLRALNLPPHPRDIRPVRICKHAWIGGGCQIRKGVTIGEGAVVAPNSVVISDIPPYSLAMGNPAEVLLRNYGRPGKMRANRDVKPVSPAATPAGES
jgi:acetyltransferase-like isoleucine patch superfamily enzyme